MNMQPNKKRKAAASSRDVGEADVSKEALEQGAPSDEKSDSHDNSQDIVNVDFEFFDPRPDDYHGVKALLRTYVDDVKWDLGGFVDVILSQTTVGTVIKTAEDESPIGVISVLNLGRYKNQTCVRSIHQFLQTKCSVESDVAEIEALFEKHPYKVGLLVSERIINLPEELAPPLYCGLLDEILWATEDEPTKALRDSFKFKYYLIMTRIFQKVQKKIKDSKLSKKVKRKIHRLSETEDASKSESAGELIYTKPEDELFHELSHWSCKFPVHSEALATHKIQGLREFRLVMVLDAEQMKSFRLQFCSSE